MRDVQISGTIPPIEDPELRGAVRALTLACSAYERLATLLLAELLGAPIELDREVLRQVQGTFRYGNPVLELWLDHTGQTLQDILRDV